MDFDIIGNPDYGFLRVDLDPDETFYGESGAMSYMSTGAQVKARMFGGLLKSIFRKAVAGESLMVGEYRYSGGGHSEAGSYQGGRVALSPRRPGSIVHERLDDSTINLTRGTFLACSADVDLSTKFAGLRGFFSGEGAFFMRASGRGDLFFTSYGAIVEREVSGALTVDTGHLVAWDEGLSYSIGGMGGLKSTLFSGEGLTMRFSGHGRIWLQTRTVGATAGWVTPYLMG